MSPALNTGGHPAPGLQARERFRHTVDVQIGNFASARLLACLRNGSVRMEHYHTLLLTLFHQSYEGPYNMALAAVRCGWRHGPAKEFLLRHAQDEATHWRWILEDLQATGYAGPDPRNGYPHSACVAYMAFAERISEHAPYARLATNSVLEGIAARFGATHGRELLRVLQLKPSQASFLLNHAETDRGHIIEIEAVIDACQFDNAEWAWMEHTAVIAGQFYRAKYDHDGYAAE